MRVVAGLMLLALLALPGTPAIAETGDEESEAIARAVVRAFLGFTSIPLTLDLSSLESLTDEDPPAPDMTGGCDPVLSRGGHEINCGPVAVPVPPGGGGGGGGGGVS